MVKIPATLISKKSATALFVDNGKARITIFSSKKEMHEFFEKGPHPFSKKAKGLFYGELPRRQALIMALDEEVRANGLIFLDYVNGEVKTSELVEADKEPLKIVKSHSKAESNMLAILSWKAKEETKKEEVKKEASEPATEVA